MRTWLGIVACALGAASCGLAAHNLGRQTAEGAFATVQQNPQKTQEVAELMGKGATKGAAEYLTTAMGEPAIRAELRKSAGSAIAGAMQAIPSSEVGRISADAGGAFALAFSHALTRELGEEGEGPLARAMAATAAAITASALSSGRAQLGALLPACPGGDPALGLGGQVRELARQAGIGFAAGARQQRSWLPLAFAFLAGFGVALLLALLIVTVRRSPPRPAPRAAQLSPVGQH